MQHQGLCAELFALNLHEIGTLSFQQYWEGVSSSYFSKQVDAYGWLTSPFVQALVAAQLRNSELEGLLYEAQTKIGCAAKHRKSAQKQLDAQEQDFEKLGQRLKVPPFSSTPLCHPAWFHGSTPAAPATAFTLPSRVLTSCPILTFWFVTLDNLSIKSPPLH